MRFGCLVNARKRGNYVTHSTDNRDSGNICGCIALNGTAPSYLIVDTSSFTDHGKAKSLEKQRRSAYDCERAGLWLLVMLTTSPSLY